MSLLIGNNLVVTIHYKLTDDDGNMLDSSEGSKPLSYLHGKGNIIPGLEKALVGKVKGDSLEVTVEPEEGYGEVIPDLIKTVERSAFKDVESIKVGMVFEAKAPDGSIHRIIVQKVEDEHITINANHPLAGVVLHFAIDIVDVREATEEEIAQGYAH